VIWFYKNYFFLSFKLKKKKERKRRKWENKETLTYFSRKISNCFIYLLLIIYLIYNENRIKERRRRDMEREIHIV